jgi:hypothetical protein
MGSPCGNKIIVIESMSKRHHHGLKGTSPGHTSTKLPHVDYCNEIFRGLIRRNKVVQQDNNYGRFVNQDIIHY